MRIRTLTVELLRAGKRHNQLLSPLTQYLGVCGNAAAGTVTVPYEHREMEAILEGLSYEVSTPDDYGRRQALLDTVGQKIAEMLSLVPGVPGALTSASESPGTLTHLRIVFSASELAMLPFEVSKVPTGAGAPGVWLALHGRSPVCITRHLRSVSSEGMQWPTNPRILFVAGPDTPFQEHRLALQRAMSPWKDAAGLDRLLQEAVFTGDEELVILEQATLTDIKREVNAAARMDKPFTHVHVLAHGDRLNDTDPRSSIGLALHDEVVPGSRLATALTSVVDKRTSRPTVVTLATCNSASVKSVLTPDASLAHDLHDQGIPLVVASQFPLTVEGSVPFVERFYEGQLRGEHPLLSLYDVRLHLHSVMGHGTHDWASLVVYEALPSDLPEQIRVTRYWLARRGLEQALVALESFDGTAHSDSPSMKEGFARFHDLKTYVEAASARLETDGPYALEGVGLQAAAHKRIAVAAFRLAIGSEGQGYQDGQYFHEFVTMLESAREEYWRASKLYLSPEAARRSVNLHWLLGQVLSLDVVLGKPLNMHLWTLAYVAAQNDTNGASVEERAWAHGSVAELALLRLAEAVLSAGDRARLAEETILSAARILDLRGKTSPEGQATRRQFDRYVTWWGNPALRWAYELCRLPERSHWQLENGLVPTAKRVVEMLSAPSPFARRFAAAGEPSRDARPAPTTEDGGGGKAAAGDTPAKASPGNPGKPAAATSTIFDVEMLPAENGDCLWIEYGDRASPRRILIDCGAESTARLLAPRLAAEGPFELFVLTHIDADHINGVVPLFSNGTAKARFEDIWFNGWRQVSPFLSVKQAEKFSKLLEDPARGLPWNRAITPSDARSPAPVVVADGKPLPSFELGDGMRLTVLSPGAGQLKRLGREWTKALRELDPARAMLRRKAPPPEITDFASFDVEALARKPEKRDPSVPNGSSIALLAEFDGRAVLLTGDAYPEVLVSSIEALQRERGREGERLKLDACKLSHHGSANATTAALLDAIDCRRYLVSTNGNIFYHPDRETIARVITRGGPEPTLVFNYRSAYNGLWDEPSLKTRYGYRTEYPAEGAEGLRVSL